MKTLSYFALSCMLLAFSACSKDNAVSIDDPVEDPPRNIGENCDASNPSFCGGGICVAGQCRNKCSSDEACGQNGVCVRELRDEVQYGGCRLPDEVSCSSNSDCGSSLLVCAGGECRPGCDDDGACLGGDQACIDGACYGDGLRTEACGGDDPGTYRCNGAILEVCSVGVLGWGTVEECANEASCLNGRLSGTCGAADCEPMARTCDGDKLKECASDGSGFDTIDVCASAGLCEASKSGDGACEEPACEAGFSECTGATLRVCRDDRTGFDTQECYSAELCEAGRSTTPATCAPPECTTHGECNGQILTPCADSGQLLDPVVCMSDEQCVVGTDNGDGTFGSCTVIPSCSNGDTTPCGNVSSEPCGTATCVGDRWDTTTCGGEHDYYLDGDSDGFGAGSVLRACAPPSGYVTQAGDCDDTEPLRYPGAFEACDGIANDCANSVPDVGADAACWGQCVNGACEEPLQLAVGLNNQALLTTAGRLLTVEANTSTFELEVLEITNISGTVVDVDVGEGRGCAATSDGNVHCWGVTTVASLVQSNAGTDVAVSKDFTCVRNGSQRVQCWGAGQVGTGVTGATTPRSVLAPDGSTLAAATHLSAGRAEAVAVVGGRLAVFGPSVSAGGVDRAQWVGSRTDFVSAAIDDDRLCAVTQTGRVWCSDHTDPPGDGNQQTMPSGYENLVEVKSASGVDALTGVVQVSVTEENSCARTNAGAALCWGGGGEFAGAVTLPDSLIPPGGSKEVFDHTDVRAGAIREDGLGEEVEYFAAIHGGVIFVASDAPLGALPMYLFPGDKTSVACDAAWPVVTCPTATSCHDGTCTLPWDLPPTDDAALGALCDSSSPQGASCAFNGSSYEGACTGTAFTSKNVCFEACSDATDCPANQECAYGICYTPCDPEPCLAGTCESTPAGGICVP